MLVARSATKTPTTNTVRPATIPAIPSQRRNAIRSPATAPPPMTVSAVPRAGAGDAAARPVNPRLAPGQVEPRTLRWRCGAQRIRPRNGPGAGRQQSKCENCPDSLRYGGLPPRAARSGWAAPRSAWAHVGRWVEAARNASLESRIVRLWAALINIHRFAGHGGRRAPSENVLDSADRRRSLRVDGPPGRHDAWIRRWPFVGLAPF
jgi:hypothetical protein